MSRVSERRSLLPINVRAERSQRVQVCRGMITDQVDGPDADDDEQCDHGDYGSADHDVAPFIVFRAYPRCGWGRVHKLNIDPTTMFRKRGALIWRPPGAQFQIPLTERSKL